MKKKAINIIKLIAGLLILGYIILYKTSLTQIAEVLKDTSVPLLLLSYSMHAFGIYLSAVRWKLILNEGSGGYSTWDLSKSYLVSNFFNLFLPRFGGDIVRISDTKETEKGMAKSAAVVFVERLSGAIVLILFALVAVLVKFDLVKNIPQVIYPVAGLVAILIVFFIVWRVLPGNFFAGFNTKIAILNKILNKIHKLHVSIQESLSNRIILLKATGYSVLLQLNVIIHFYLIGLALNIDIPLTPYFYIIPIVTLALSFPVTPPNGMGLKEFIIAKLFVTYGYGYAHAVSFSFLDTLGMIVPGIMGFIIYISRKK